MCTGRGNVLDVKRTGSSKTERQNWLLMVGLGS